MIRFDGPPAGDAAPRLFDIHAHGAMGHEFGHDEAGTAAAVAHHRARGTGALVASLVTATDADLVARVGVLAPLVAQGTLAGIHLEGPFLSVARCGAHDPALVRDPDVRLVERLVDVCANAGVPQAIRHLTFAPERPGAAALVAACARHGILPAVGHTDAGAALVARTLTAIADATGRRPLVTHLFNGMPRFHHRDGGPAAAAWALAARGEAVVELITDGVHLAPEVVRLLFETVGPDAIVLVSDAGPATGLGDGEYVLGALPVLVADGVARRRGPDGTPGAIAGSTRTVGGCVDWASEVAGVARADALRAATVTPAALLAARPG